MSATSRWLNYFRNNLFKEGKNELVKKKKSCKPQKTLHCYVFSHIDYKAFVIFCNKLWIRSKKPLLHRRFFVSFMSCQVGVFHCALVPTVVRVVLLTRTCEWPVSAAVRPEPSAGKGASFFLKRATSMRTFTRIIGTEMFQEGIWTMGGGEEV